MSPALGRSAVVVGSSIAGMCAARVLADRVDSVTIIERDSASSEGIARSGVPQGHHFHLLLARGGRELERLFPGFEQRMLEQGAHRIDLARDVASLRLEGWLPHDRASVQVLLASRGLTERVVRELLSRRSNVSFLQESEITGLSAGPGPSRRVTGVRLRSPGQPGERELAADLVVDASGRRSNAPRWLEALGLPVPSETVVDGHCGYSTRWFQAPEPASWPTGWWWKAAWVQEDEHTVALLFPVEQQRWVLTLVGQAGRYPPSSEQDFMEALRRMRSPLVDRMLQLAVPVTGVRGYRDLANRFRHYERWDATLEGFLAVGDAVCALNPVYGQGMTTATLSAGVLAGILDRHALLGAGMARAFFAAQEKMLRVPWQMAVGADFRFPGSEGPRPPAVGLINGYMNALVRAAMAHHELRVQVDEVLNMLRPPETLFTPKVAARVAAHELRRRLAAQPPVSEMPPGA